MDFDLDQMPKQKQKATVETGGIPPLPVKTFKPNPPQKKKEASVETGGIPPLTDEARSEFRRDVPACARHWSVQEREEWYQKRWKEKFTSPPPPQGE